MRVITQACPELQQIAETLRRASKIVVLTGAGVSTCYGIPDFRSANGLRNLRVRDVLNSLHEPLSVRTNEDNGMAFEPFKEGGSEGIGSKILQAKAKDLFEVTCLRSRDSSKASYRMFALLKEYIIQEIHAAGKMHTLIGNLRATGRLLRCYTQNIDGLEALAGCLIYTGREEKFDVLQLHGGFTTAYCRESGHQVPWDGDLNRAFMLNQDILCPHCSGGTKSRQKVPRARLRPGVVLYGEDVANGDIIQNTIHADAKQRPDFLLIAGTSLSIPGARDLVKTMAKHIQRPRYQREIIAVGDTKPGNEWDKIIDVFVQMDIETFAAEVSCSRPVVPDGGGLMQEVSDDEEADILNWAELCGD